MNRRAVLGLGTFGVLAASVIGAQAPLAQEPAAGIAADDVRVFSTNTEGRQDTFVFYSNAAPITPAGGRIDIIRGMGTVPGEVVARPAAPPPPPPPKKAPARGRNLEEAFTSRWLVWLGALAIALAGTFFVRYAIDHGFLGPVARVTLGFLGGIALALAGEWLRRRPLQRAIAARAGGCRAACAAGIGLRPPDAPT